MTFQNYRKRRSQERYEERLAQKRKYKVICFENFKCPSCGATTSFIQHFNYRSKIKEQLTCWCGHVIAPEEPLTVKDYSDEYKAKIRLEYARLEAINESS
jgi:hypothetical protein